jgi:hypothetical protein
VTSPLQRRVRRCRPPPSKICYPFRLGCNAAEKFRPNDFARRYVKHGTLNGYPGKRAVPSRVRRCERRDHQHDGWQDPALERSVHPSAAELVINPDDVFGGH